MSEGPFNDEELAVIEALLTQEPGLIFDPLTVARRLLINCQEYRAKLLRWRPLGEGRPSTCLYCGTVSDGGDNYCECGYRKKQRCGWCCQPLAPGPAEEETDGKEASRNR